MYFVGADKTQKWESDVRSAIATEGFNEYSMSFYDEVAEKVEKNEVIMNHFVKTNEKLIANQVASYAASASQSSTITY